MLVQIIILFRPTTLNLEICNQSTLLTTFHHTALTVIITATVTIVTTHNCGLNIQLLYNTLTYASQERKKMGAFSYGLAAYISFIYVIY